MKKILFLIVFLACLNYLYAFSLEGPIKIEAGNSTTQFNIKIYNSYDFDVSGIKIKSTDLIGDGAKIESLKVLFSENNFLIRAKEHKNLSIFVVTDSIANGKYLGILTIDNGIYFNTSIIEVSVVKNTSMPEVVDYFPKSSVNQDSMVFQIATNKKAVCRYSRYSGLLYDFMEGSFDYNYETLHKKTLAGLSEAVYRYYVKCKDDYGNIGKEKEVSFIVSLPISAKISFSEDLPLSYGTHKLKLTTSKPVYSVPNLDYSLDAVSYTPIPLSGSGSEWIGYIFIPESIGEAVGSFKFLARDLEGNSGQLIKEGSIFNIDTLKPYTITSLEAIGNKGSIKLSWFFDSDVEHYNIYKSNKPNIGYIDFYRSVNLDEFIDNDVENGKTYYYRVCAVDSAGNKGDLSKEVYATALFENTSISSTGLDISLLGAVESFLSEIDSFVNDINELKSSIASKGEKERTLFSDIGLSKKIDASISELASLRRDVEKYKLQDLTKTELDNKINSARLRLNIIKKQTPENIIITGEKSTTKEIKDSDIESSILELEPYIEDKSRELSLEATKKAINDFKVSIADFIYICEVVYMDGTRQDLSIIKKKINSEIEGGDEIFLLETIPKDVATSASELNVINLNYEVLKEDPVLSFSGDTKQVLYYLNRKINIDSINDISLIPVKLIKQEEKSSITGYFLLDSFKNNKVWIGAIAVLAIMLFGLFFYFKNRRKYNFISALEEKTQEFEKALSKKDFEDAKKIYSGLNEVYVSLNKKEKKVIYPQMQALKERFDKIYKNN
ncbi:MAG: hypothetical protein ACP5OG_05605 [Candidatus Nanoarchaeia archaeon]